MRKFIPHDPPNVTDLPGILEAGMCLQGEERDQFFYIFNCKLSADQSDAKLIQKAFEMLGQKQAEELARKLSEKESKTK